MTLPKSAALHPLLTLPAEIAFLARHGLSLTTLAEIATRAAELGQPADFVAIREGYITEANFYAALAAEVGAPLVDAMPPLAERLDGAMALRTGVAALASPERRFALAAEGRMIPPLLTSGELLRRSIVLMRPSIFRTAIRAAAAPQIANMAALGLVRTKPGMSAMEGPSQRQIAFLGLLVFMLSFFGTLEPAMTVIVGGLILGPLFLLLATFRIAAAFEPDAAARRVRLLDDAQLPMFSVLAPLYREVAVLDQLI
ncbi:MAG: hypothetical protein ACRCWO_10045, partial [Bosea sp. (in: a-proteobacteria)]